MVSTWTASASESSRRARSSSALSRSASAIRCRSQPVSDGDAELLLGRGDVQQLADVSEVGQPALAAQPREHAPRDGLGRRDRVEQRRDAAAAEQAGPAVQLRVQLLQVRLVRGGHLLRAPAEEGGERGRSGAGGRDRPLDRLEQPQPLVRGRGREDAAGAVDHRRDADALERVVHERGQPVGRDEHRDVARPDRHSAAFGAVHGADDQRRGRRQEPNDVGGKVVRDHGLRRRFRHVSLRGQADERIGAVQDPHAQRRA